MKITLQKRNLRIANNITEIAVDVVSRTTIITISLHIIQLSH